MPSASRKTFALAAFAVFFVIFNLGYVFHDLLFGQWFHEQQPFAREHYVIPYIALAFAVYAMILAHLYPIYRAHYARRHWLVVGLQFGWLMGLTWDALQGGIIEVATFPVPLSVFALDSGYHVFVEGSIAGIILARVCEAACVDEATSSRYGAKPSLNAPARDLPPVLESVTPG